MHDRGEGVGKKTESDGCLKRENKGIDQLRKNNYNHNIKSIKNLDK